MKNRLKQAVSIFMILCLSVLLGIYVISPVIGHIFGLGPQLQVSRVNNNLTTDSNAVETGDGPFYGIWCSASKNQNEAQKVADRLTELGFAGQVYISSEWSNLEQEKWYCVSADACKTQGEAEKILQAVQKAGYDDAYVKYSGEYIGNKEEMENIDIDSSIPAPIDTESKTDEVKKEYTIEPEWDMSNYPEIIMYVHLKDANNGQSINVSEMTGSFTWITDTGKHWSYDGLQKVVFQDVYYFKLMSDQLETADELLEEWKMDIHLECEDFSGDMSASVIPANELSEDLLSAYLAAYISDVNIHSFDKMMQYIETDVPDEDRSTIFYQMRTEVTNGFLNTLRVALKDFQINKVEYSDEKTLHLYTTQRFDSTYEEPFSVWKNEGYGIADSIRQLVGEVDNQQKIRLSANITWHPEYFLRKSADGNWKFYSYAGDLSLTPNWSVYEAKKVS